MKQYERSALEAELESIRKRAPQLRKEAQLAIRELGRIARRYIELRELLGPNCTEVEPAPSKLELGVEGEQ
jgi:hypothetical protein